MAYSWKWSAAFKTIRDSGGEAFSQWYNVTRRKGVTAKFADCGKRWRSGQPSRSRYGDLPLPKAAARRLDWLSTSRKRTICVVW
ncbi:hypothetical protein KCP75_06595 [Salmonella enterica subsp. enterica]|nr:hypothetical protein KCP75_06595 [Salmonella enterica subsp. enterica]